MTTQIYEVQVNPDGTKLWYQEGKLHRLDGPAVEYASGSREWFKEGKRHRLDGPAIVLADGTQHWYQEGKLHRLDGPAIEWADGTGEWYQEGKWITQEEGQKLSPCDGKIVEIDGKKYKLVEVP